MLKVIKKILESLRKRPNQAKMIWKERKLKKLKCKSRQMELRLLKPLNRQIKFQTPLLDLFPIWIIWYRIFSKTIYRIKDSKHCLILLATMIWNLISLIIQVSPRAMDRSQPPQALSKALALQRPRMAWAGPELTLMKVWLLMPLLYKVIVSKIN